VEPNNISQKIENRKEENNQSRTRINSKLLDKDTNENSYNSSKYKSSDPQVFNIIKKNYKSMKFNSVQENIYSNNTRMKKSNS